jgi:trans-aconitate methyltransferase
MQADQKWNVGDYQKFASFVPQLGQPLLDLLQPEKGEAVLDLGCGDGALTEKLAEAGCVVTAVDSSPEMVAAACARGLDAHGVDARELTFDRQFDAVFSNAVLHWVKEPEKAVAGVFRALKPGGRFVAEFGGKGNVRTIEDALITVVASRGADGRALSPWYYPAPEEYKAILERQGFVVDTIALIPRPTPLPNGMAGWLKTFAGPFLKPFPPAMHAGILEEAEALMKPVLCDAGGNWHADYVRLRLRAHKP